MRIQKNQLALAVASLAGTLVLTVAPVWAQHGADSGGSTSSSSDSSTSSSGGTSTSGSDDSKAAATTGSETETETHSGDLKEQAKTLVAEKRQNVKEHTQEQKQKACEAHKTEIANRGTNYAAAAQRHLDVFNSIFTKVKAFHDSKQLTVSNYDELVAAATAKQAAAQTAVDALKAVNVNVDCTQSDPAQSVATLKTAVKNARAALQDYRTALKNLVVALKGASTSAKASTSDTTPTTTGGNQ